MGVDAGNLIVAALSLASSVSFTLLYVRRQTRATERATAAAQRQLALSEQIRREQSEPYVVVDICLSDHVGLVFVLVIENIGPTVARNVKISFDPPLQRWEETVPGTKYAPIEQAGILADGIPLMPPGRRIEIFFDRTSKRLSSSMPTAYVVTVDADGPVDRVETMTYNIDLAMYRGVNLLGVKGTHDGVKEITKLVAAGKQIARAMERASVALDADSDSP